MTRQGGEAVAQKSNLKIRAANGTATASAAATAVLWLKPNDDGYDKENGSRSGHNGNRKDHLKSGPQWSEGLGAPHAAQIGEAFPNAFLGVMMPHSVFQRPIRRGIKSDVFWKFGVRNMILERLIETLYGNHAKLLVGRWHKIDNHDERAAFVCALTARAHELGRAVVIPGNRDGEILLPPSAFIQDWALNELVRRIPSLKAVIGLTNAL